VEEIPALVTRDGLIDRVHGADMMSDSELQGAVLDELIWEPSVNAAHIGVSVKGGIVTLTGHVTSYSEKYAAEQAAKRVNGVRAVANELDVKLPESSQRTDEDIAAAAVNALRLNNLVPADQIRVIVSQGLVKLEGEVEWQYQKEAAESAVRHLPGVTGVSNLITVKPKVTPTALKIKLREALKRSAERDARRIKVEVQGSKVILRGTVQSWAEKEEAERATWSAPGISEVESHIVVTPPKPRWVLATCLVVLVSLLVVMVAWTELAFRNWLDSPRATTVLPRQGEEKEPPDAWKYHRVEQARNAAPK
jgi:osmotically-inducible protein OsmY